MIGLDSNPPTNEKAIAALKSGQCKSTSVSRPRVLEIWGLQYGLKSGTV